VLEEPRLRPQRRGLVQCRRQVSALEELTRGHRAHPALCEQPLVLPYGGGEFDGGAGGVGGDAGADRVHEVEHRGAGAALLGRQQGEHLQERLAVPGVAAGGLSPQGVDVLGVEAHHTRRAEQHHPRQRVVRRQLGGPVAPGDQRVGVVEAPFLQGAHQGGPAVEHQRVHVVRGPLQPGLGDTGAGGGPGQHGHPVAAQVPVVAGLLQQFADQFDVGGLPAAPLAHLAENSVQLGVPQGAGETGTSAGARTEEGHVRRLGSGSARSTGTG